MNRYKAICPAPLPTGNDLSDFERFYKHCLQTLNLSSVLVQRMKASAHAFHVLDTDFGAGIQFLLTMQLWARVRLTGSDVPSWLATGNRKLVYFGYCTQVLTPAHLRMVLSRLDGLHGESASLIDQWPDASAGWHCMEFAHCTLYLWLGPLLDGLADTTLKVDCVYAHPHQIHECGAKLAYALGRVSRADGYLQVLGTTSQAEHAVLSHAGFLPLQHVCHTGTFYYLRRSNTKPSIQLSQVKGSPMRVAVIGAGIAGSSVAQALCCAGAQVDLFDSAAGPATGASGNWLGAFHPHITRDDSPLSRLTRLGVQHTLHSLKQLTQLGLLEYGIDWATPGHLQTMPHEEAQRTQETLAMLKMPDSLVQWAAPGTRANTHLGGMYFPKGGWIKPHRWVQANLQACSNRLQTHYNSDLQALPSGYDAVVLACAQHSLDLLSHWGCVLKGVVANQVKGQITKMARAAGEKGHLPLVLSGESYAIDAGQDDWLVLGATYERPVLDLNPTASADVLNIERFKKAFPSIELGGHIASRCAVRSVWADRLPAIGMLNAGNTGKPAVYLSTGFASRGLVWAALGGALIRDQIMGGCWPNQVPFKLLDKINPNRFSATGF